MDEPELPAPSALRHPYIALVLLFDREHECYIQPGEIVYKSDEDAAILLAGGHIAPMPIEAPEDPAAPVPDEPAPDVAA